MTDAENPPPPFAARTVPAFARTNPPTADFEAAIDVIAAVDGYSSRSTGGNVVQTISGMVVCGDGELIETFLVSGQVAVGKEIV